MSRLQSESTPEKILIDLAHHPLSERITSHGRFCKNQLHIQCQICGQTFLLRTYAGNLKIIQCGNNISQGIRIHFQRLILQSFELPICRRIFSIQQADLGFRQSPFGFIDCIVIDCDLIDVSALNFQKISINPVRELR